MTIGIVVSGLVEAYVRDICKGVSRLAKQEDVNVVIIPAKYYGHDYELNFEYPYIYQFNSLFPYTQLDNLDGIIVEVASVCMFADDEHKKIFASQYANIPHVYIAYSDDTAKGVFLNNASGLLDGLHTLYNAGVRKFGMITGQKDNVDAIARRETFLNFLDSNNLPHDEDSVFYGDFFWPCEEQINDLFDAHPDVEAVICGNDIIAGRVYKIAEERGRKVGEDLSVLGFDDSFNAATMNPPLSSVRTDCVELGAEAFRSLMRVIRGDQIENLEIGTKFVMRKSFTCFDGIKTLCEEDYKPDFFDIIKSSVHVIDERVILTLRSIFNKLVDLVLSVSKKEMTSKEYAKNAVEYLDKMFELGMEDYIDIGRMINIMDDFFDRIIKKCWDKEIIDIHINIKSKCYREMVFKLNASLDDKTHRYTQKVVSMQSFVRDTMAFERGNDLSYVQVLSTLKWMNIKNAVIYMYDHPVIHFQHEDFIIPEKLSIKAVLQDGETLSITKMKQHIKKKDIFKNKYFDWKTYNTAILMPIFFNEIIYGVFICDMPKEEYLYSELLVSQVSSGIKMLSLLGTNEKLLKDYEATLRSLKENNIVLENISKSDALSGLYNRRGFESNAQKFIDSQFAAGKKVCIFYVDMNNLKIINDRFGHQDGDFSLKVISDKLKEHFGDKAVIGRIGGDEFCVATEPREDVFPGEDLFELYESFSAFNEKSDKDYNITVSAGACVMDKDAGLSLSQAMTIADEDLYKVKALRTKNVIKEKLR